MPALLQAIVFRKPETSGPVLMRPDTAWIVFGPAKAPSSSGYAGTAVGLQKIVVGGWGTLTKKRVTALALGEQAEHPPGKNQLGVLPGSVETAPSQEPWYVPETWMTRLQAGRSFTCRARSCVSTRTCRRRLSCSR